MNDMKKTKEGVNLKKKKFLRLKNTGSILVLMGLLIIFVIALYTFILQSSYTKTALDIEIARDTASADAVHKLVDGRISKEDFDQIKDQSDEKKQIYKDISSYFNEIRTLNSTRYIYTAKKNEEGKLVYVVDGLDPDADDVRHPGDYIEEEMVPYIDNIRRLERNKFINPTYQLHHDFTEFFENLWKKFWDMKKYKIEGWCIAEVKLLMHQPFKISQLLFQKFLRWIRK